MRTDFQRDRDRIIHSASFRRLQHKTQVLAAFEGDHYRSRMTHSLEVSQMARSAARALGLNTDLAEATALAHDLGHPPFGHAGEQALNEMMQGHGGFRHNAQGVRIVDCLEHKYGEGHGLNLVFAVRRSLLKRLPPDDYPIATDLRSGAPLPLEATVVDLCDRIAYLCHDLDDGLRAQAFDRNAAQQLQLWTQAEESARHSTRGSVISEMISMLMHDLVRTCAAQLAAATDSRPELQQGEEAAELTGELQSFLRANFYRARFVLDRMAEGRDKIAQVFEHLRHRPQQLPTSVRARIDDHGLERTVCDYVAGMTDRFLLKQ